MNPEAPQRRLRTWLFNPAVYIAGGTSLILGVSAIALTSWIGSYSQTHFDGVLDVHTGLGGPVRMFLGEGLISWLSAALLLWIAGRIASRTPFRSIDLFGTQALARWPMLLIALATLAPGYVRFSRRLMETVEGNKIPDASLFTTADAVPFYVVLVLILLVTAWMVSLMYRSYAHVCHIRGGRAAISFILAVLLAEAISKVGVVSLIQYVASDDFWRPRQGEIPGCATNTTAQHERRYTFDTDEGIEKINGDKGLTVGVENGEFRIHGTTTDETWGPDSVRVPVTDEGGMVDVSGRFRIAERESSGLVFLEANTELAGPIIFMYQWFPPMLDAYQIQTRWFHMPFTLLSGRSTLRALGNEETEFNTMRIHVREDHQHADLFVNDTYLDTIVFTQYMGAVVNAKMELQTPRKGKRFDIRFDDLTIRWDDSPLQSEREQRLRESGGLLLHYTFDEPAADVADDSGQMCPGSIVGQPRWVDGVCAGALALDGADDYVSVPSSRSLRELQKGSYTIALWFNPSSVPGDEAKPFALVVKPGGHVGLSYDRNRRFRCNHYFACDEDEEAKREAPENVDGIMCLQASSEPCLPHRWHHVAGVVSPQEKTVSIYIDGELAERKEWDLAWNTLPNDSPWYVGVARPRGQGPSWRARGIFDDVRLYNRALSPDEIRALRDGCDTERAKKTEDSVRALTQEMSDENSGVRYGASLRLCDLGTAATSAVPALIKGVYDLKISAGPALALGKIGVANEEVRAALEDALTHDSKWDRAQAATALSRLNMKESIPALAAVENDADPDVRRAVSDALTALRTER